MGAEWLRIMPDFGLVLFVLAATATPQAPAAKLVQSMEQRIIISVPTRFWGQQPRRFRPGVTWEERPARDCQRASEIAGARFNQPGVIDLLMRDQRLIRAHLSTDCVALDYYSALYLVPGEDGRVCAGRDVIVSRSGVECPISSFGRLEPRPAG